MNSHIKKLLYLNYDKGSKKSAFNIKKDDRNHQKAKKGVSDTYNSLVAVKKEQYTNDDMELDLRTAIAENEFFLCYQPLIDTKSQRMVWMEALIRWGHPKKGIINPLDFIPIAEETGLIIPIGEWVLENACMQLKIWQMMGYIDYGISVNVSAIQLQQPGFSEIVRSILKESELRPEYLEIEITESVLIEESHIVIMNLAKLSEIGVKIVLDDFGTGYNSLKYFQEILVNGIKIDKIFISNIKANINKIIIDTVISLGHKLNAEVTAEGVETMEQYEYLKSQGCDKIQGYYFSKPLLPDDIIQYMNENRIR